jgi:RHS repeat-associated protein
MDECLYDSGRRTRSTGKERDRESGSDYFLARYYSGAQGRFLSSDRKTFPRDFGDPQSWNKYAYARNNPLRYVDPDGKDFWDFLNGMANATSTNAVAGIGRQTGNRDFTLGQKVGDAISVVSGLIEIVGGGGAAGGGVVACGTGVLCAAGAPATVVGTAIAVHGATQVGTATAHLMNSGKDSKSGGTPEKDTSTETSGAQDKKLSATEVKILEQNTGLTAHEIKADTLGTNKNLSKFDLYKNRNGDIVVKPKGSSVVGEQSGYTADQLKRNK